jgi:hypothetical protein
MDSHCLLKLKVDSSIQNSDDVKNIVSPSSSMVFVAEESAEKKKKYDKKLTGEEGICS